MAKKNIEDDKGVTRLIKKLIKSNNLPILDKKGVNNYDLIKEMVLVGLGYDFYCEDYDELLSSEYEIKIETPEYRLNGFIDKLGIKDGKFLISDFKSSEKFDSFDTQALCYILWAKRVKNMDSIAEFIYLRKPEGQISRKYEFTDSQIDGFEMYVKEIYKQLKNFNRKKAQSHFAYDDGYPGKDEGFKGAAMCGRSQYKGHLKKDGTEMWSCPNKHPQEYYVCLKNGEIIKSDLNYEALVTYLDKKGIDKKEESCYKIQKVSYSGCLRFYSN